MHGTRKPIRRPQGPRQRPSFRPKLDLLEERTLLSSSPFDSTAALSAAYGQLPLSFERNDGQTDAQVDYLARGQGYTIFLTPQAAVLSLQQAGATTGEALRMELLGGNANAVALGVDQLGGMANYYVGNDPAQWHTDIPTFGRVEYANVYNGVNVVYYGNQQQL